MWWIEFSNLCINFLEEYVFIPVIIFLLIKFFLKCFLTKNIPLPDAHIPLHVSFSEAGADIGFINLTLVPLIFKNDQLEIHQSEHLIGNILILVLLLFCLYCIAFYVFYFQKKLKDLKISTYTLFMKIKLKNIHQINIFRGFLVATSFFFGIFGYAILVDIFLHQ